MLTFIEFLSSMNSFPDLLVTLTQAKPEVMASSQTRISSMKQHWRLYKKYFDIDGVSRERGA